MSFTMELNSLREYHKRQMAKMTPRNVAAVAKSIPVEERLEGLTVEERLAGLPVEERLAGLTLSKSVNT